MNMTTREETISKLIDEFISDAIVDFTWAMQENVNASKDEIRKSVLKELDYKLSIVDMSILARFPNKLEYFLSGGESDSCNLPEDSTGE